MTSTSSLLKGVFDQYLPKSHGSSLILVPNVCLYGDISHLRKHELHFPRKIQNISDGFFILSPGSCPRGGTWGYLGAKIKFRPVVCPLCYLLLSHWTKLNQIWCVSYSHEWGAQCKIIFWPRPWGPGEGSKGQIPFNFNYKVNFKDFYSKLCVCSHK